jgi:hypothetical protein
MDSLGQTSAISGQQSSLCTHSRSQKQLYGALPTQNWVSRTDEQQELKPASTHEPMERGGLVVPISVSGESNRDHGADFKLLLVLNKFKRAVTVLGYAYRSNCTLVVPTYLCMWFRPTVAHSLGDRHTCTLWDQSC